MGSDLQIDLALVVELAGLTAKLRALRIGRAGLTQQALGERLRVAGGTVSDWELGRDYPTLAHLLAWCRQLEVRLLVIGPGGQRLRPRLELRAGEKWAARESRRLATALRAERLALRRSPLWLATRLGTTRSTVSRWENSMSTPRVLVLTQWASVLGCSLALESRFTAA